MTLKNKIKSAVKADEMIEKCQVCSERKKQIVAHHPIETNPVEVLPRVRIAVGRMAAATNSPMDIPIILLTFIFYQRFRV